MSDFLLQDMEAGHPCIRIIALRLQMVFVEPVPGLLRTKGLHIDRIYCWFVSSYHNN